MGEEGREPIYGQASGLRMEVLSINSLYTFLGVSLRNRTYKDGVSWWAKTPAANRINGRWTCLTG